ncbi:hypothetical protein F3Y22_tig00111648pilonHSYRG00259 [Hibiscus syriacus]|uniref:Uncharacterized protein n=1 Tax=Hibiscus syriacus TaxID=106335 RepID=A0A6A2Y4E8_HIBSY|nr:hypothetical protein F3Y22_tig00111648pilonHSYRG00259 [Hibiscus syriacus]
MYENLSPNGSLKLYEFIAMVTVVMIFLSQLPFFHSLRHINFASSLLGVQFPCGGACIHADFHHCFMCRTLFISLSVLTCKVYQKMPLLGTTPWSLQVHQGCLVAFTSMSIIAAIFGNGILLKYNVPSFYSVAVSGYWLFGNKSNSNILKSLMPDEGPALAPTAVLGLAVIFVLLQLLAIGLVSHSLCPYTILGLTSVALSSLCFFNTKTRFIHKWLMRSWKNNHLSEAREVLQKEHIYRGFSDHCSDVLRVHGGNAAFLRRNKRCRGSHGLIPLDFILPMLLYNMTLSLQGQPSPTGSILHLCLHRCGNHGYIFFY